jgi:hypothetical protein
MGNGQWAMGNGQWAMGKSFFDFLLIFKNATFMRFSLSILKMSKEDTRYISQQKKSQRN